MTTVAKNGSKDFLRSSNTHHYFYNRDEKDDSAGLAALPHAIDSSESGGSCVLFLVLQLLFNTSILVCWLLLKVFQRLHSGEVYLRTLQERATIKYIEDLEEDILGLTHEISNVTGSLREAEKDAANTLLLWLYHVYGYVTLVLFYAMLASLAISFILSSTYLKILDRMDESLLRERMIRLRKDLAPLVTQYLPRGEGFPSNTHERLAVRMGRMSRSRRTRLGFIVALACVVTLVIALDHLATRKNTEEYVGALRSLEGAYQAESRKVETLRDEREKMVSQWNTKKQQRHLKDGELQKSRQKIKEVEANCLMQWPLAFVEGLMSRPHAIILISCFGPFLVIPILFCIELSRNTGWSRVRKAA